MELWFVEQLSGVKQLITFLELDVLNFGL